MAASDYFRSAYPEPWQLLGVSLRPFSLGHYLKLHRLGNAFVSDDVETATLGDLILGVVACSMRSHPDPDKDEFWQWLNRKEPTTKAERIAWGWRKLLCRVLKKQMPTPAELDVHNWGRKIGVFDVSAKAQQFADYIAKHSECPRFWEEQASDKKSGAHWAHAVIHALTSKCGYTQEEAYNVCAAKALADYFKHAENEGAIRLMTPQEIEFIEKAEAQNG